MGSDEPEQQTKRCSACGQDKPVDDFARDRRTRDGRRSECNQCRKEKRANGQRPGPRGTVMELYQRNSEIFRRWLRFEKPSQIGVDYNLSDEQVRQIVKEMMAGRAFSDKSSDEIVDEMAARIEDVVRELGEIADRSEDGRKITAASKRLDALNAHFALMTRSGRVQTEPDRLVIEHDLARVVDVIFDVFERYKVPTEAQKEIRDAVGTIESAGARELPSGEGT